MGFGNTKPSLRLIEFSPSPTLATLHLPEEGAGLQDVSLNLRVMRLCRLVIRSTPLMSSFYETSQIQRSLRAWGNETDIHLFADFLGDQNVLCTLVFLPYIKREDKRLLSHIRTPQALPRVHFFPLVIPYPIIRPP